MTTFTRIKRGEYDYLLMPIKTDISIWGNGITGEILNILAEFESKIFDVLSKYEKKE